MTLQTLYPFMLMLITILYAGNLSRQKHAWNIIATCVFLALAFSLMYITFVVVPRICFLMS